MGPYSAGVFNPRMLDASIRDIVARLGDDQKAEVLLYAARLMGPDSSRSLVENAVQSCLQIPALSPTNQAKARLLRVKARLAAGVHQGVHQELQAILALDPDHPDAKALLFRGRPQPNGGPCQQTLQFHSGPRFSTEIWREILSHLPRRDLKSVLAVQHGISRIAGRLLFRELDLHFGVLPPRFARPASDEDDKERKVDEVRETAELERWHAKRCADVLTRVIVDPEFARVVKTLRIIAPLKEDSIMTFQTGMLANALPKLVNLQNLCCQARYADMVAILAILQASTPKIQGLSLTPIDFAEAIHAPNLRHLTQLAYQTTDPRAPPPGALIAQNRDSLRAARLHGPSWSIPGPALPLLPDAKDGGVDAYPFRLGQLTSLRFDGFARDAGALAAVLEHGRALETLALELHLDCALSGAFRKAAAQGGRAGALPRLRRFAFAVTAVSGNVPADPALFPALCDFVRNRQGLRWLRLRAPGSLSGQRKLGYDAAVWGVLPSLPGLRGLGMTMPESVAPQLAMWLIPRGLRALSLWDFPTGDPVGFVQQLRGGVPPTLKFVELDTAPSAMLPRIVQEGFPMVNVVCAGDTYWSVKQPKAEDVPVGDSADGKEGNGLVLERWSERRVRYYAREWLEWYGCEDARWPGFEDFDDV
ncbi:hypothetical protein PUNSTDRAFT_47032 [Punctularia strigosozonata HHB-11173 SS5]|uniref:F-box domain-containing protein n=1 Tax=Punctularia strigosozonata (strain HHB-11173) TaxID=741275 RepID=R7S5E5_PUNST|nr:uncharacterized protein PUNSTDRAFT_47032 [Punctularia strigosozonata HHB-11173 SS5]EIN05199.1 hypothetical protein PUNSTDRAFT_47032 [Punctularia strigosozonata HHB-11173 SS5]